MAQLEYAPNAAKDIERIFDYFAQFNPYNASDRIRAITDAIPLLKQNPLIGRPYKGGKRALVVGTGSSGYLVLYRYLADIDTVFVLAIRSQRQASYPP